MTEAHASEGPSPQRRRAWAKLLDRFEEAWQSGTAPRIEDVLPPPAGSAPDQRSRLALLMELVQIDLEYRWRRKLGGGNPWSLEDYLTRYPELGPRERLSIDLIAQEYEVRQCWGDRPSASEYATRFPHLAAQLRDRLAQVDAALSQEFGQTAADRRTPRRSARAQPAPATDVASDLPAFVLPSAGWIGALRQSQLLSTGQMDELVRSMRGQTLEPRALGRELLKRQWLTAYQVNQLSQGRGQDLLLGPYVLLEHLGEGGTGLVFKARHQKLQRVVALKVLRKELLADADVVARFYREIQVVSQLDHPNVVRAYDAGPAGPIHFLAMEYVEGTDLGRMVKQCGPLPVAQACEYVRQAALGLQHAHERGLVHRDIKPHNLIMSLAEGLIKVTDLGLARLPRAVNEEATACLTGGRSTGTLTPENAVMMGTTDYLAPEQALDFHQADIRADIYSLGCTFYYLLIGQPPFAGGTLAQKLLQHQQAEPPALEPRRRDVPPALAAVLRKMLAKTPGARFQTPAAVAAAVAPFCQMDTSVSGRGLPRHRRWQRWAGMSGAVALAVMLLFVVRYFLGTGAPSRSANEMRATATLDGLRAQLQKPNADRDKIREALLKLRMDNPGTPAAREAGALQMPLSSPLDRLPGQAKGVVAVLGDNLPLKALSLALSPDDRTAATGSRAEKDVVRLWDLVTGKELPPLTGNQVSVTGLAFAPDGKWLAATTDRQVKVWNLKTRDAPIQLPVTETPGCVAFSPDASLLAVGCERGIVRLWNVGPWRERSKLAAHQPQPFQSLAFTPDGQTIAAGSQDMSVELWDVTTGSQWPTSSGMPRTHWVAFAPQGQILACVGNIADQLWDLAVSRRQGTLRKSLRSSGSDYVAFTPDGQLLVTASGTMASISVYQFAGNSELLASWPLPANQRMGASAALALDGRHLVLLLSGSVHVMRLPSGGEISGPASKR